MNEMMEWNEWGWNVTMEEEERIRQWHMMHYERNNYSNDDFDEHIKASINKNNQFMDGF